MNRLRNIRQAVWILLLLASGTSCSGPSRTTTPAPDKVTVYINAADAATRTFIGGDNLDETLWSELDRINVYWHESDSELPLSGAQFGYYKSFRNETLFSATLEPLETGIYDYYGCYPAPDAVEGRQVSYLLPAHQNGTYDMQRQAGDDGSWRGNCDIMIAEPVRAAGAITELAESLRLEFVHQCHALRISVPENRNLLGSDIARLRIQFPTEVVGTLTADLTAPHTAPVLSDGQSTVWIDLDRALKSDEERYLWIFTAPVTINGNVTFTAYDTAGCQSQSISVALDKELQAGRITPVNLTVPQELPVKWLDISIDGSNLGEEVNSLTITAPDGVRFRNGTNTCTFEVDESDRSKIYTIGYYPTIDDTDNEALLKSSPLTITYDSDHALLHETRSLADAADEETNRMRLHLTVPYLFAEDFSGISKSGSQNSAGSLDGYNLPGWTGHYVDMQQGTAVRIESYLGSSVLTDPEGGSNHRGRLDSPALSNLKEGASVSITVSYDISGTSAKGTLSNPTMCYAQYQFGSDTSAGTANNKTAIQYPAFDDFRQPDDMNGSYSSITNHVETELASITSAHRLAWRSSFTVVFNNGWSVITDKNVYIYLDNIKVSIKK